MLSDHDQYQLSKYHPGRYHNRCTYTPSGEASAAVATRNGFTISKCMNFDETTGSGTTLAYTEVDIGEKTYTVIMYCPILSHLALGGSHPIPPPLRNKQISGLTFFSTNYTETVLDIGIFFGYNFNGASNVMFSGTGDISKLSMTGLVGFESSADLEAFSYSGQIQAQMVIPAANLTGTMFKGTCRLGQLFNNTLLDINGRFKLANLINTATEVVAMSPTFDLQSAIVNDYLLTHTLRSGTDVVTDLLKDAELGAEIIHYAVLQTPAKNITDGGTYHFSIIGEVGQNAVVLPSVNNLLLYRTFQSIWLGKQHKEIDFEYQGPESALANLPPPVNRNQLENELKKTSVQPSIEGPLSRVFSTIYDVATHPLTLTFASYAAKFLANTPMLADAESVDFEEEVKSESDFRSSGKDDVPTVTPLFISRKAAVLVRYVEKLRKSNMAILLEPSLRFDVSDYQLAESNLNQFQIMHNEAAKVIGSLKGLSAKDIRKDPSHRKLAAKLRSVQAAKIAPKSKAVAMVKAIVEPKVITLDKAAKLKLKRQQRRERKRLQKGASGSNIQQN